MDRTTFIFIMCGSALGACAQEPRTGLINERTGLPAVIPARRSVTVMLLEAPCPDWSSSVHMFGGRFRGITDSALFLSRGWEEMECEQGDSLFSWKAAGIRHDSLVRIGLERIAWISHDDKTTRTFKIFGKVCFGSVVLSSMLVGVVEQPDTGDAPLFLASAGFIALATYSVFLSRQERLIPRERWPGD